MTQANEDVLIAHRTCLRNCESTRAVGGTGSHGERLFLPRALRPIAHCLALSYHEYGQGPKVVIYSDIDMPPGEVPRSAIEAVVFAGEIDELAGFRWVAIGKRQSKIGNGKDRC